MTPKLIKELESIGQLMSDVSRKLTSLSEENKNLRVMLSKELKVFNELIDTVEKSSTNNEAKITNVKLWAESCIKALGII